MQGMVDLIVSGATGFTPELLVRLIVFVMILDCIGSIAHSILKVGRR